MVEKEGLYQLEIDNAYGKSVLLKSSDSLAELLITLRDNVKQGDAFTATLTALV